MNTLELLSQYLSSPIVAQRHKAMRVLFGEALNNKKVITQLEVNLQSSNFDILLGSLKTILALAQKESSLTDNILDAVFKLGKKSNHFDIILFCKDILTTHKDVRAILIEKRITPDFREVDENEAYFHDNCDYAIEYKLGNKDNKYELSHLCRIFRYDCKKAFAKVESIMKDLGYEEKKGSRKERPHRWRNDYEGHEFENDIHYYARNSLKIFLTWCIQNLKVSEETWSDFLVDEQKWDPSLLDLLEEDKPEYLIFSEMNMDTEAWFKKRIKKYEAYEFLKPKDCWIALYEVTNFETDDKDFDRHMTTCFAQESFGKILKKLEISLPHYKTNNAFINDLPVGAKQKGKLYIEDYNSDAHQGLLPSFGLTDGSWGDYVKIFPAPEIIEFFDLKQKKNSLEYYKGNKLVVKCVNWRGGYKKNMNGYGEDRFELSNYGYFILIREEYLKKFMEENKLKLLAKGSIWKRKQKRYGSSYDSKNSKHKWLPIEVLNI